VSCGSARGKDDQSAPNRSGCGVGTGGGDLPAREVLSGDVMSCGVMDQRNRLLAPGEAARPFGL